MVAETAETAGARRAAPPVSRMLEDCLGCKWTIHVLEQIRQGVTRPGALVRTADGLTTKVLNERLGRLLRFGILEKTSYPEVPPRVEYQLTAFGRRFIVILDQIRALQDELQANGGLPASADADRPVEQR